MSVDMSSMNHSSTSNDSNKGLSWRDEDSESIASLRKSMNESIVFLLQQKRPNATLNKLPHMAKLLEEKLFYNATCLHEYNDYGTLKNRLTELAISMNLHKAGDNKSNSTPISTVENDLALTSYSESSTNCSSNGNRIAPSYQQNYNNGGNSVVYNSSNNNNSNNNNSNNNNSYNNNNSNNIIENSQQQGINNSNSSNNDYNGNNNYINNNNVNNNCNYNSSNQQYQQHSNYSNNVSQDASQVEANTKKKMVYQQQERLLQLRHASKCKYEAGTCPEKRIDCASMKVLWTHVNKCKDKDCEVRHCKSSLFVLTHYSQCKDPNCPVCKPIRMIGSQDQTMTESSKRPYNAENDASNNASKKNKSVSTSLLDPISCSLYSLSNEQIYSHIDRIRRDFRNSFAGLHTICLPPLEAILLLPHVNDVFGRPVDPVALNLPDYYDIITKPMDLGTVKKKLDDKLSCYRDVESFINDVNQVFDNAIDYNPDESEVYALAVKTKQIFETKINDSIVMYGKTMERNRTKKDTNCKICGEANLKYEPPVYYCNGSRCVGNKIRKGAPYYSGGNNQYHWCMSCYGDLKENQPIKLLDCTLLKSQLVKNKMEDCSEQWVNCDVCGHWIHWVCGMFNGRRNFSEEVPYCCPHCLIGKRSKVNGDMTKIMAPMNGKRMRASDLPQSTLSKFLELRIQERLQVAYSIAAATSGISIDEVEKCNGLVVRCVSSYDKDHVVKEGFASRYKHKNYPEAFPCRVKCLVLFQNVDGQDVILFGMYVYEYGHKCPQPNQRRVYISYLDSVHYFHPRQYRTMVYHEILVSYLDYMKKRGFHTVHIWACSPAKGDDYILYIHPPDQKTPKDDKLQKWYKDMLDICVERKIVVEISNVYKEYLEDVTYDASVLPYFEGDYFVDEAELTIKELKEGKQIEGVNDDVCTSDRKGGYKRKGRHSKSSKDFATSPRSLTAAAAYAPPTDSSIRDPLMAKFAVIGKKMQSNFFVARLYPKEYADRWQDAPIESFTSCGVQRTISQQDLYDETAALNQSSMSSATAVIVASGTVDHSSGNSCSSTDTVSMPEASTHANGTCTSDSNGTTTVLQTVIGTHTSSIATTADDRTSTTLHVHEKPIKEEAQATATDSNKEPEHSSFVDSILKDDTEDVDEPVDSPHWDSRESFLRLCSSNSYQFDEIRRSKLTTMMVLYHMHNPDAPARPYSCSGNNCHKDILHGFRMHCATCEVDYCIPCFSQHGPKLHPKHRLAHLPVSASEGMPQLTEEERKERQKNIQLHLQLLQHASSCVTANQCTSRSCQKMKDFLSHVKICKNSNQACPMCKRVHTLLQLHARNCRLSNCLVPNCSEFREHFKQMQMRQQLMDDRRRAKMNAAYNN